MATKVTWRNDESIAMTLERLSGQDLTQLVADEFGWPGHIGVIAILDRDPLLDAQDDIRVDVVRRAIERRLAGLRRFRQVIYVPPPWLGGPLWMDVPGVDLAHHVRARRLAAPAHEEELLEAVEALRRRPFDPARPLWELWLLTGLYTGQVGLFLRLHHAVADGSAAAALLGSLLGPGTIADDSAQWTPAPRPSTRDLFRDGGLRALQSMRHLAGALARPRRSISRLRSAAPALREFFADGPVARTSLNRPIGPHRRIAVVRHHLEPTKRIARAAGATVNDVMLAALGGALRRVLLARGEPVDNLPVRISVPVSLHDSTHPAQGNLVAPMAVPVHIDERDDVRRLGRIAADTAARRRVARAPFFAAGILGTRPAQRVVMRLMRRQRLVNAYLANVVGPTEPLRLAGAELLESFAMVPITANVTLGVGALSYAGQLNLTVVADLDSWPDLPILLDGLERSWDRLAERLAPDLPMRTDLPARTG